MAKTTPTSTPAPSDPGANATGTAGAGDTPTPTPSPSPSPSTPTSTQPNRYRIVPSGAGGFPHGHHVTEEDIRKTGGTLADWLEIGSVVPEGEPDPVRQVNIPRPPAPLPVKK